MNLYRTINNATANLVPLLVPILFGRKFRIGIIKGLIATILTRYTLLGVVATFLFWMNNGFENWGVGGNIVVTFVYTPLFAFFWAKILRTTWARMSDFLILLPLLLHGFYRIACTFAGCCHGYPCSFGLYSGSAGMVCFPIQMIESLWSFLVVGFLLILAKKKNYETGGVLAPLGLILYGGARFFFEFLHDNEKLVFGCSAIAFQSLFMAVVGAVMLVLITAREKRASKA